VTVVLGAVFLAGTAREWYGLIVGHGLTIGTNLFGTTFYSLVGLHASHVIVGLVILGLLCVFSFSGALRRGGHRARGDRVVVLALRRRRVDRRLHRGLPGGPVTPPPAAEPQTIEMPAPTAWPLALALGITLTVGGLVTNVIVSAVGAILTLAAALGWWRQVLPEAKHEHVPMRSVAERARPIAPSPLAVGRLDLGEGGHRMRIPVEVQPISAGVRGGIVGGAAMALVALAYGAVYQHSLWYPVNLLSAVAMPGWPRPA